MMSNEKENEEYTDRERLIVGEVIKVLRKAEEERDEELQTRTVASELTNAVREVLRIRNNSLRHSETLKTATPAFRALWEDAADALSALHNVTVVLGLDWVTIVNAAKRT